MKRFAARYLFSGFFLALAACSRTPVTPEGGMAHEGYNGIVPAPRQFTADESLVRHYDLAFHKSHRFQPFPRSAVFSDGTKTITFVGTRHVDWKGSTALIDATIKRSKPQIMVIEGLLKSWGMTPRYWDAKIRERGITFSETYFAYQRGLEENIPMIGAEPGRLSDFSSYDRDIANVRLLAELLNQYDHILVVFGAGHLVQEELTIQKMLGPALVLQ